MKKRKVNYRAASSPKRQAKVGGVAVDRPVMTRSTVADINLLALEGRGDVAVGDSVRIGGGGLYAGELATVDSVVAGIIPSVIVRTGAGKKRRVRAIDLERVGDRATAPRAATPPAE